MIRSKKISWDDPYEFGPNALRNIRLLNLWQCDFELQTYLGFGVLTALDRADQDYTAVVKPGEYDDLARFVVSIEGVWVKDSFPSREEAERAAKAYVDLAQSPTGEPGKS